MYGRRDLVDFLKEVFGAQETHRGTDPEESHANFKIGDSMLNELTLRIGKLKAAKPESAWDAGQGHDILPSPLVSVTGVAG
jgi:hypothetical protein